jgi:hypothetical protein
MCISNHQHIVQQLEYIDQTKEYKDRVQMNS